MYRSAWYAKVAQDRSVLGIALDVHMRCTGGSEGPRIDLHRDIMALEEVISTWKPSLPRYKEFDDCVYNLILATLAYAKKEGLYPEEFVYNLE